MTQAQEAPARKRRKTLEGIVVSDRMDKTRVVKVERLVRHPFYEKVVRRESRFYVHDPGNASHEGDLVEIASTRPLSKTKRWRLARIVKASPRASAPEEARA